MKACKRCGETKPLETFAKDKRRADGRGSYCKGCENARNRERAARLTAEYVPSVAEGSKPCSMCGETKPLTEFDRRKDSPSGFRSACSDCTRVTNTQAMQRWRKRNPELDHERAVAYREANREKERERYRRYDKANHEKRRTAIAKSRAENPEHHRALRKADYQRNKAAMTDRFYRYLEQIRNPSPDTVEYIAILHSDPCSYCGGPMGAIDHITPRSAGGPHNWTNLTAACRSCNPSKRDWPLLAWFARRRIR